jgi:hypothetical protein
MSPDDVASLVRPAHRVRALAHEGHRAAPEVLDTVMDGPFLLADLPAGRYQVEAALGDKAHQNSVTVGAGGLRQTVFYFDTHDEVEAAIPTP